MDNNLKEKSNKKAEELFFFQFFFFKFFFGKTEAGVIEIQKSNTFSF